MFSRWSRERRSWYPYGLRYDFLAFKVRGSPTGQMPSSMQASPGRTREPATAVKLFGWLGKGRWRWSQVFLEDAGNDYQCLSKHRRYLLHPFAPESGDLAGIGSRR